MKKILTVVLLVLVVATTIVCTGCDKKKDDDVIRIGAILPLTGQSGFLGVGYKNAMDSAVDYLEKNRTNSNYSLQLICEDSGLKSSNAISIANKLIQSDKCDVIIAANSNIVDAVLPITERSKIPLLAISSTPDMTQRSPNLFRVWMNAIDQVKLISSEIVNKRYKNIALIYINNEYGKVIEHIVKQEIPQEKLILLPYEPNVKDFKNELLKIRHSNVDCFYIEGNPSEYVTLIKQIRELGFQQEIYGSSGLGVNFVYTALADNLDKVYFSAPSSIGNAHNNKIAEYFNSDFQNRNNSDPEWFFGFCFDQILFIDEGVKIMKQNNSNNLITSLISVKSFKGVNGEITIDEYGDSKSINSLYFFENGIPKLMIEANK
ncbi:ABC transporter substrate-binding protein [bacterium]|nr:ABC transporter substrate-binding protein [bacterium]